MFKLILISVLLISSSYINADELSKDAVRTKAAKDITDYLDKSVNPCDNFFKFACGNWKNFNNPPKGQLDATGFSKLNHNIQTELKEMLEQNDAIYNADVELKVKQFYKSCLNTDVIKSKGFEPIKKFVQTLGDFPIINKEWDETKFDYVDVEEKLKSYGFDGVIGLKVLNDKDKLYIGEISLPFNKEGYSNPQVIDQYINRIVEFLKLTFGIENEEAGKIANEIVEFEKQLSVIVADEETKADQSKYFVHTTVEELNKKYPKVQWEKFLTQSIGTPIELSKPIVEFNPNYIKSVMELIEKASKKTVANFMIWHGIGEFVSITVPPLGGDKDDIWKYCIAKTKEFYPKSIAVMYSKKYYDNEVQKDVEEIFNDIKKSVRTQLEKLEWIDDVTKKLAFERLDAAKIEIVGYPKGVDVPVASDFGTIVSNPDEYYENVLNKLKYNIGKFRSKVVSGESIEDYIKDPASLVARYVVEENTLKISLGFLNPPFYTKTLPRNMKFAQLGAILVHELLHGFDALGQTIPVSNVPAPWWSQASTNTFNEKSKCFAEQYTKNGGTSSLNDNVADNGGLKYSFETYKNWAESIKESNKDLFTEETFPGIDYTNTQLFFLTHAQTWCHYSKMTADSNDLLYPSEYRINLPMTNLDSFSKEFQCPEGSPMNPKDKCVLW
ncbi:neprilysin-4-like [Condylostylus longicornis]|uniref:neprilysin-4-like n=1 Tax=Condylostylus longicornis TaxID=2530218 RepID=UPI00244DAD36|nr:neprilysin-4-like [Condylostylus longicornis]